MLKESILAAFFALCLIVSALFAAELLTGPSLQIQKFEPMEIQNGR